MPIDLIEKIYMELKETTVKSHRMEEYEVYDKGGRVVCKSHGFIGCGVCHYINLIEKENENLKAENKLLKEMRVLNSDKQQASQ